MLSFIIIGRNEGWKLTKCLQSVFDTIKCNKLKEYETIYVDSKSSDDSIERANKFSNLKIFQITGICNAAIARNIGAKESSGDVLFFIDGDMEIVPKFLSVVYSENKGLKYNFVSGDFENIYYSNEGKFLNKKNQFNLFKDILQVTTGGLFIIKKKLWVSVKGMKTKYRKSQDLDLGLRLSKKGIKFIRKREVLAKHHTVSYNDSSRMWKKLFSNNEFYRIVLLRDHFNNLNYLLKFMRENYTSVLFLITVISIIFFKIMPLFIPYIGFVLVRSIINMRKEIFRIPSRMIYFILRDISIWFAFFLFWPKEINNIEYKEII